MLAINLIDCRLKDVVTSAQREIEFVTYSGHNFRVFPVDPFVRPKHASYAWTDRLKRVGTRISMDGRGRCLDNTLIERLWRSLKYECVYLQSWETGILAKAGVGRWGTFYSSQRSPAAHGGQPPAEVYFKQIQTDQQGQRVA